MLAPGPSQDTGSPAGGGRAVFRCAPESRPGPATGGAGLPSYRPSRQGLGPFYLRVTLGHIFTVLERDRTHQSKHFLLRGKPWWRGVRVPGPGAAPRGPAGAQRDHPRASCPPSSLCLCHHHCFSLFSSPANRAVPLCPRGKVPGARAGAEAHGCAGPSYKMASRLREPTHLLVCSEPSLGDL